MIYAIEAVILVSTLVYFLSEGYFELKLGVTPVASSKQSVKKMLEFIPVGFGGKIVDFGSAWGGLALKVARARPESDVTAIEFSLFPYLISILRLKFSAVRNMRILREDFFKYSLKDTGVVICYLPDPMMKNLSEKFRQELPPGALIISHDYPIPGWQPEAEVAFEDLFVKVVIYVYKITRT